MATSQLCTFSSVARGEDISEIRSRGEEQTGASINIQIKEVVLWSKGCDVSVNVSMVERICKKTHKRSQTKKQQNSEIRDLSSRNLFLNETFSPLTRQILLEKVQFVRENGD